MAKEQQPQNIGLSLRLTRRQLGIASAFALGIVSLMPEARIALAGGGGPIFREPQRRDITDEEKQGILILAADHEQRTKITAKDFFNKALFDKYGYEVKSVDLAKTLDDRSKSLSPNDPLNISSDIQLSPVKAVGVFATSFYDRGHFIGNSIDIYIPQREREGYSYYIPELDSWITPFARGEGQILVDDMERALVTVFNLPANTQSLGFLDQTRNPDEKVWEGTTKDGSLLRAYVNSNRRLGIFLRP